MHDTTFCTDALADLFFDDLKATEDLVAHMDNMRAVAPLLMRAALIKNLKRFDDEVIRAQVPKGWKIVDRVKRTVITLLGEVTYQRRIYIDEYGNRRKPLDEVLGIAPHQRVTPDAFRWMVRRAADVSFRKAAAAFADMTGCAITAMGVWRCVQRCAALIADGAQGDTDIPISAPFLYAEFDGFWVHLQTPDRHPKTPRHTYKAAFKKKSREMKVWVAYAGKDGDRRIHPVHWASASEPADFFAECIRRTSEAYDLKDVDYLSIGADAAGWCKAHGLDIYLGQDTGVIEHLDSYHINARLYKAFTSEQDRGMYLDKLYAKDFSGLLYSLDIRLASEPDDERVERRLELRDYIANNLDWLDSPSLSRLLRESLLERLDGVFCGRPFAAYLHGLLEKRAYGRFLSVLATITARSSHPDTQAYAEFVDEAKEAIRLIKTYGRMTLGTMEGTNSKVYAARLKVWSCAWSEAGALAMMRVRAQIASKASLPAPVYDAWLTKEEKQRIEKWLERSPGRVDYTVGEGYEPVQGHIALTTHMEPHMYGLLHS